MTRESLQVTNLAGDLSKIFGAKVHVIVEKQNDEVFAKKLVSRINIVTDQFEERTVDSTISYLEPSGALLKKVLDYTKKNNGDFIALAYHTESMLPMFDTFAQNLVVKDLKLPCLIVNAKSASNYNF